MGVAVTAAGRTTTCGRDRATSSQMMAAPCASSSAATSSRHSETRGAGRGDATGT